VVAKGFVVLFLTVEYFLKRVDVSGIFKVETIGDCYVAVCGLPESNKHHAMKMAKFASSCLGEMTNIINRLERSLGPGTADLALRVGLHSGPTIAGVLRGEKARFQLFGDTVSDSTSIRLFWTLCGSF
jgi:class 3 adenylate cyclase